MTGCVICHQLPRTGNWTPWSWPLKSYTHEQTEQILQDLDEVLTQRDTLQRELDKLKAERDTLQRELNKLKAER